MINPEPKPARMMKRDVPGLEAPVDEPELPLPLLLPVEEGDGLLERIPYETVVLDMKVH